MSAATAHVHTPGSYSLSLMIHGALVLGVLLSTYIFKDAAKKTSGEMIVLVAGAGDNYMATEAPALGIEFTAPADPVPSAPPADAPDPVTTTAPVQSAPVVTPESVIVPPAKKTPAKNQPKTQSKTTPAKQPAPKMSKADFDRLHAAKNQKMPASKLPVTGKASTPSPVTAPKIGSLGKGLDAGVTGGTGAAPGADGTALTACERAQMDGYFALLLQRIKEAHVKPEGLSDQLVVRVEYQVSAGGSIGAIKIIRSSGNRAFDDSVLKAFRTVGAIGPRPDGLNDSRTANFHMKEADSL